MDRDTAKKKAMSRDCSCVMGEYRDSNYNAIIDEIFDNHENKTKELLYAFVNTMEFDVKHKTYKEDIDYFLKQKESN